MEPEDDLLAPTLDDDSLDYDEHEPPPLGDDEYDPAETGALLPQDESFDPASIDDETLVAELQRRQHLYQQSYSQQSEPDPRLTQIVELSQSNPEMAEALRMQIAEERIMQRIGPTLAPLAERQALDASGLTGEARQYLSDTFSQMPGIDGAHVQSTYEGCSDASCSPVRERALGRIFTTL